RTGTQLKLITTQPMALLNEEKGLNRIISVFFRVFPWLSNKRTGTQLKLITTQPMALLNVENAACR
ncbi:MAG: hypothetical protein OEU48_07760, partial [Gammaproteobacteria bacterium]|nr:hypothetical protein [Gammaproteobacteria bacterium]